MNLTKISLTEFKNYEFASFDLPSRIIGICGLNGKGKTNLLDAIYYCCFTKSYFSYSDQLCVRRGAEGFRIEAEFERLSQSKHVICVYRGSVPRKELRLNGTPYERLAKHVGILPAVIIAPDDVELVTGSSDLRRRFVDSSISQVDPVYLQALLTYNKILQHRNSLLKNMPVDRENAHSVIDILDKQILLPAREIFQKRTQFLNELIPQVQKFYSKISRRNETVSLQYISQLNAETMESLLLKTRSRDVASQRSNTGIHKDDIHFSIDGELFRNMASQGQRKSLLFAMKFASFELLKQSKEFAPLLLLDDVFEKLDAARMKELLRWVCLETNAKVFITDTHRDRLEAALHEITSDYMIVDL